MTDLDSEKQLGLNCFLCNAGIASDSSYSIYYTVMPHSGTLLMNAIQKLIRKNLDQYLLSSSFLCTKCFSFFEQLDSSEERCKGLRSDIMKVFVGNFKNRGFENNVVPGVACQTDNVIVENVCGNLNTSSESPKPDESATSMEPEVSLTVLKENATINKKILRSARSLHRYVHPCTICGRLFRRPCEVNQHMLSHDGAKPYKCGHCSRRFGSKSGAAIHALKKHGVDNAEAIIVEPKQELTPSENVTADDQVEPEEDLFPESQDDVDTKNLKRASSSSESDDDIKNEDFDWKNNADNDDNFESDDNWDSNSVPDDVATVNLKNVKDTSPKVKKSPQVRGRPKGSRKVPAAKLKTRKRNSDEGVEKSNKTRPKKIPGEQIRLDCSICGKQWRTRSELKAHEATHSTERPFICEICGQAYKHKPALDVHVGMHQGINPFCCPYCKKSFTQKGALQRHLPIHTGDAPFQCELCGKRFVHHTSFNMHTLAHTGEKSYKCGVCGLALLSASHLKRHTRVHTGERPYQCPTCGKRFAERYNLAAHQRIHQHSASKLHSCQLCGAGFDRKPKLEDHLASCHNKISDNHKMLLDESRKWLGHPHQMPGEMNQSWHLLDPNNLLPPRMNMMQ